MAQRSKLPTAPLLSNDKVAQGLNIVDRMAGKPLSWWFFFLFLLVLLMLFYCVYYLNGQLTAVREWQFTYVTNDQRAMVDALKASAIATDRSNAINERTNIILQNLERKQSQQ